MPSPDPREPRNSYIIDIESAAETARLIDQDYLFTKAMGGLFPEEPDLAGIARILDIACGPGGWATEVAFHYPDIEVVGVDINENMVKYARAMAKVQRLENVSFEIMDIKQGLKFPDNSFDLVNARFIIGFMDNASWPELLQGCYRILRAGGILRLTENETEVSNSRALQRLWGCFCRVLAMQDRTFSVDQCSIGITPMFDRLLREAGFEQIAERPYLLKSSYGAPLHYSTCKDLEVMFALLKPYITRSGIVGEAEYDELYYQLLIDLRREEFLSLTFGLTAWGKKPAQP
jgi:ubiquinone/menaquinone biosynthesis C-methylase UbiE